MRRRQLIAAGASMPLLLALPGLSAAARGAAGGGLFDDDTVPSLARASAARAYAPPVRTLPPPLDTIDYDQFRDYRFRPERALWRDTGAPFQAQLFHRGFLFKDRVDLHLVGDGRATPLPYRRDRFDFGPQVQPPDDPALGHAGFRLHAPVNSDEYFDELCVFLGASYFRAVARGLVYGLSARGLALGSGDPGPEEFPLFRAFWLEVPAVGADSMVVHALLDSPSVAGAYRFAIRPAGEETLIDVDARLYPRVELRNAGIAPLTSMFEFDPGDRVGVDDFRPAVHDSDGLALFNGAGEQAWRPLRNPPGVSHSGFQDEHPRGFGLMQRKRDFEQFQDAEGSYERRPDAWVEPLGDWGAGEVHLVELPTGNEFADNIVAFWRPRAPLAAGREHRFRYRLHWGRDHAWLPQLARVVATRTGEGDGEGARPRLFVVDFDGGRLATLAADAAPRVEASASAGELRNPVAYRVAATGRWRMSFELMPAGTAEVELRARLLDASGEPLSETWLSRWPA
ncbi:glucan biosynthesis protein [Luteimonas viscosa]|uniref:Glucans biosynthesis protein D n=1 Tax=Luteimonas viscosa TaxID=1132694 RepID=A0A5D4XSH4_9GAMM|nr:glucan biosynthesis protein G [Luteimonas viscosa]TYT25922.1 glucan biosynthesis protein [Luteimonas viscosa]